MSMQRATEPERKATAGKLAGSWARAIFVAGGMIAGQAYGQANLNATLWMQTAVEYEAAARQAYAGATRVLGEAVATPGSAVKEQTQTGEALAQLPPAVILDLDETVLDNSFYQAANVLNQRPYADATWDKWVADKAALAIPGAKEFLDAAVAKNVRVFYITNRVCDAAKPDDPTVMVLGNLQLPLVPTQLLCKPASGSDKSGRRAQVAATHRIVMAIGDDFNDFVSVAFAEGDGPTEKVNKRKTELAAHYDKLGFRWFVIPNPTYGSWDRVLTDNLAERMKQLKPKP